MTKWLPASSFILIFIFFRGLHFGPGDAYPADEIFVQTSRW